MAEFSKKLLDMMTEFLISEIGAKALDGITYAMVLKNKKDKTLYNRYITIKQEAINCGYMNDDVFRVYEVANGYIFDMDLNTAKKITAELAKAENITVGGQPTTDLIRDMPEQRRKRDMVALAKYLKSEYDSGKTEVEVALFNRNTTNTIIINGKAPNGKMIAVKYKAYAIRHWDIEIVNEKFLIPAGFRVKSIKPCEVLPSKSGVSFIFTLESMEGYNTNQWKS